jgi:TonB family protein
MPMTKLLLALVLAMVPAAGCAPATAGAEPAPVSAAEPPAGTPRLLNAKEASRAMDTYYDDLLRDAGVTGTVQLDLTLNADGTVGGSQVVSSTHNRFSMSAGRVAPRLRFTPPGPDGAVMRVEMKFVYRRGEIEVLGQRAPTAP